MDGTNGSTTFTDSSTYGHTVTPNNSAQISTAQSVFGGASGLFNKTTKDYLSVASSTDFTLSGSFTIEFRARLNSAITSPDHRFIVGFNDGTHIDYIQCLYTGVGMQFYASMNNGLVTTAVGSVVTDTWYAVAVTRDSLGTLRIFLDGVLIQSVTAATDRSASTSVVIGEHPSVLTDTTSWDGYIDELRIINGACLYTADYTVATTAFSTAGGTFTDISDYVLAWSASRSISDPVTPMTAGRAIVKLVNEDGRFNDAFTYTGAHTIPIGKRVKLQAQNNNKFYQSQDFTGAQWSRNTVVFSGDTAYAPNGTLTADTVATAGGYFQQQRNVATGQDHTVSVFCSSGGNLNMRYQTAGAADYL